MTREEKLQKKLNDPAYIQSITENFEKQKEIMNIQFTHLGEPDNYVRERYTGRGHRFYNAKEKIMKNLKQELLQALPYNDKLELSQLFKNKDAIYYVYLDINFFVKIPKADSINTTILKEKGIILPGISPDLDNYLKLIIDVLHDVLYDDDKRVIQINSNKLYSIKPRTEISAKIEIIKK